MAEARRGDEDIRIVILGKTGAGKSASGNTILGYKAFESNFVPNSVTHQCQKATGVVDGRRVSVIDTPGLFDTRISNDEMIREIKMSICFAAPGPHVFLIVIRLGRFTREERRSVELIQEIFGHMSNKYGMILFTGGDHLDEDQSVEMFFERVSAIQELITKCEGRYHVFNNKTKDRSQVTGLITQIQINMMAMRNGGSYYTYKMFQEAEKATEEKKQRILKEMEERKRKEDDELKKKYESEAVENISQRLQHFMLEKDAAMNQDCMGSQVPTRNALLPPGGGVSLCFSGKEQKLMSVRSEFIERISEASLHSLLDKLLDKDVITYDEMDAVRGERLRKDKARQTIDTVRRKGNKASSDMIDVLHQLDRNLSDELHLLTGEGGVRRGWSCLTS